MTLNYSISNGTFIGLYLKKQTLEIHITRDIAGIGTMEKDWEKLQTRVAMLLQRDRIQKAKILGRLIC